MMDRRSEVGLRFWEVRDRALGLWVANRDMLDSNDHFLFPL